jgi:hypothetical protein
MTMSWIQVGKPFPAPHESIPEKIRCSLGRFSQKVWENRVRQRLGRLEGLGVH